MQKNEILTLRVEEINNLGCGVGHLQNGDGSRGITVFVQGGVTGDLLSCRVIKVDRKYLVCRIEEILEASPIRIENDCPAAGCGGCIYRNISYSEELKWKRESVVNAFRRAGLSDVTVEEVRSTGVTDGYRNKAQYPVGNGKNGMIAGFYAGSSHRIVSAERCSLQPAIFSRILSFITSFCDEKKIKAYDEATGKGLLRHIYLRRGSVSGEVMVTLVVNAKKLPFEDELARKLTQAFPEAVSVMFNENTEATNVVLGEKFRALAGRDYLEDRLCGLNFRIAAPAFYQVNHDACELLYGIGKEKLNLSGNEKLIDLYCGIGSIGLSMADRVRELVGIEIVPEAVGCAAENAKRNGVENAYFFCGDASDASRLLANAERERGSLDGASVVLDPPRKGTTPELISYLAGRNFEKILYISCNPETLARDCALFREKGYRIGEVTPVDLFPRTGHVETVVLMSKINK